MRNCPPQARTLFDKMRTTGGCVDITGMWNKCSKRDSKASLHIQQAVAKRAAEVQRDILQSIGGGTTAACEKKRKKATGNRAEAAEERTRKKIGAAKAATTTEEHLVSEFEPPEDEAASGAFTVVFSSSHEIVHGHVPVLEVHGHSIFGCPGFYGRTAQERARDHEHALAIQANTGYYMGRMTNESPTNWVLTPASQAEQYIKGGAGAEPMGFASVQEQREQNSKRSWIILNIAWTKCWWSERAYANEMRLLPPAGGPPDGAELKMFEASNLSSIKARKEASKPGRPRGRPKGWRKDCGLTYREIRNRGGNSGGNANTSEPIFEEPEEGGSAAMQPSVAGEDNSSSEEDEDDGPPPLISQSDTESSSEEDEDSSLELSSGSEDGGASSEGERQNFGAGRYPTRRRQVDHKFGQASIRDPRRATSRKLHYLDNIIDAETRAIMNDMARGANEEQIHELTTSLSKSQGRTMAYLHFQRDIGEKAIERERKKEAAEFLDTLKPTMSSQMAGGAAQSEEQRALNEKSAAIDEELASAHVTAQPMDQGGVTLTDEQILSLPPVRNIADAFVSPLCYKLWAANEQEGAASMGRY